MYTPLINDKLIKEGNSDCCSVPVYFTNGHEYKDAPNAISTWWHVCGMCGESCNVIGNLGLDQIYKLQPKEEE